MRLGSKRDLQKPWAGIIRSVFQMYPPFEQLSRRAALSKAGLLAGAATIGRAVGLDAADVAAERSANAGGFVLCLNTATVRGFKMSLVDEIELAAKTGYRAVEPWIDKIHKHAADGGSLKDLGKRISDLGIIVESAIGFAQFIVDDGAARAEGMEQARLDMDAVAQIGGLRIAAPPAGATKEPGLNLHKAAERYRALLELGDQMGVVPELELWGHSKNLRRLSDAVFVALEAQHPKACVLADLFHLHKGGSGFEGLRLLSGAALPVVHMNDYPAEPLPEEIDDSFRVFPGDGVAPLTDILRALHATGGRNVLSLELFNRQYWKRDPVWVARTGFEKMQAVVAKALA
jgi:sugar phosphate isomerase/epimerase